MKSVITDSTPHEWDIYEHEIELKIITVIDFCIYPITFISGDIYQVARLNERHNTTVLLYS